MIKPTAALTSNGFDVVWSEPSEDGGVVTLTGSADGKEVIVVTINQQGKYEVELKAPLDHSNKNGQGLDDLISFDVGVTVTDPGGETAQSTIAISIEDDAPFIPIDENGQALVVPVSKVDVGELYADFHSWKGGNNYTKASNTDVIPGDDKLTWGSSSGVSGYDFKGNTAYKDLAENIINTQLNLGTFTHTNKPITSGSAITQATLTIELDVVIDGQTVTRLIHEPQKNDTSSDV